jgi:type III secretory pathway component EscS
MHQWLNVTLIVGGGLVIVGVIVGLLSSLANAGSG